MTLLYLLMLGTYQNGENTNVPAVAATSHNLFVARKATDAG